MFGFANKSLTNSEFPSSTAMNNGAFSNFILNLIKKNI